MNEKDFIRTKTGKLKKIETKEQRETNILKIEQYFHTPTYSQQVTLIIMKQSQKSLSNDICYYTTRNQ